MMINFLYLKHIFLKLCLDKADIIKLYLIFFIKWKIYKYLIEKRMITYIFKIYKF